MAKSFMIFDAVNGKSVCAIIVSDDWTAEEANKLVHGQYAVTAVDQRSHLVNKEFVDVAPSVEPVMPRKRRWWERRA